MISFMERTTFYQKIRCNMSLIIVLWYYRSDCFIRSSRPEMFLGKGILKICSKFTGEHLCGSAFSIKFLCNFIKIALWHGCSPVNLLHIFRTPFPRNTFGWLLLFYTRTRICGAQSCRIWTYHVPLFTTLKRFA